MADGGSARVAHEGLGVRWRRKTELQRGNGEERADDYQPWERSHRNCLFVCAYSTRRRGSEVFAVVREAALEWDASSIMVASRRYSRCPGHRVRVSPRPSAGSAYVVPQGESSHPLDMPRVERAASGEGGEAPRGNLPHLPPLKGSLIYGELCIYADMFFIFCRHHIREHATADQGVRVSDRLHAHVFSWPPLQAVQHVHESGSLFHIVNRTVNIFLQGLLYATNPHGVALGLELRSRPVA